MHDVKGLTQEVRYVPSSCRGSNSRFWCHYQDPEIWAVALGLSMDCQGQAGLIQLKSNLALLSAISGSQIFSLTSRRSVTLDEKLKQAFPLH